MFSITFKLLRVHDDVSPVSFVQAPSRCVCRRETRLAASRFAPQRQELHQPRLFLLLDALYTVSLGGVVGSLVGFSRVFVSILAALFDASQVCRPVWPLQFALYDSAFAALVRLYGKDARSSITGVTLIAGFASTVGWPVTALLEANFDWRVACSVWAAVHLLVGLPLNWLLPEVRRAEAEAKATVAEPAVSSALPEPGSSAPLLAAVSLGFVFAATSFVSTAMAAHLPGLLAAAGASAATAVLVASLIGPAQVAARLLEFGLLRKVDPLLSARVAVAVHPVGAAALLAAGPVAAPLFGVLHGAGNGLMTIAKGTLPLSIFGTQDYGRRQGLLVAPARVSQALAPWLFGLVLASWSQWALVLTMSLGAMAMLALLPMRGTRLSETRSESSQGSVGASR
jgi:hypothetical protein